MTEFFGIVEDDSMKDVGILSGDLAVIDRSVPVTLHMAGGYFVVSMVSLLSSL